MSKGEGLKIGIKFTEDLVGDVSLQGGIVEKQDGEWTANGSYSGSYPIGNAKDESTSSYWQSRSTDNYIQIYRPSTKLLGFKVYKGSSYRPSNFTLSASEDGVDYFDVTSGSLTAATGWETIMFNSHIEANYFRINFGYSSRLYLYELVLIIDECEFTVTGQEYKYVNGELIDKSYQVVSVESHPTEPKSILLTLDWWSRFNNVEGELTVKYDATKGSLTGAGGAVESFEVSFTPTDLVQTPNPNVEEHLKAYPYEINLDFKEIDFQSRYVIEEEHLKAYPYEITLDLKHVSEINP